MIEKSEVSASATRRSIRRLTREVEATNENQGQWLRHGADVAKRDEVDQALSGPVYGVVWIGLG